jgi:hypothetical protein
MMPSSMMPASEVMLVTDAHLKPIAELHVSSDAADPKAQVLSKFSSSGVSAKPSVSHAVG